MRLRSVFCRKARSVLFLVAPVALCSSLADTGVLWGLKEYLRFLRLSQTGFWFWLMWMSALLATRLVLAIYKQHLLDRWVLWTEGVLRLWLMRLGNRLPSSWFHRADAMTRLRQSEDAARTVVLALESGFGLLSAAVQLVVFIPLLFWLSWPLTLGLLILVLPLIAWLQRTLRVLGKRFQERLESQASHGVNLRRITALQREWSLRNDVLAAMQALYVLIRRMYRDGQVLMAGKARVLHGGDTLAAFAVVLVLFACGMGIRSGVMNAEDLILYGAALLISYKPAKEVLRTAGNLREGMSAWKILSEMDTQCARRDPRSDVKEFVFAQEKFFHIQKLDFSWRSSPEVAVFRSFDWCAEMKRPLWIRGGNGCGKTTLLRLMAGLEHPDAGILRWPISVRRIAFLPQRLSGIPLDWMRWHFSRLLEQAPRETRMLIARLLPDGFPERSGMSAGQLQRTGIAWIFLSGARVFLLDEPLAFIVESERREILQAMLSAAREQDAWLVMTGHDHYLEMSVADWQVLDLEKR